MGNKTGSKRYYWRESLEQWDASPIYSTKSATAAYVRLGSDNPKFKALIKAGTDATNSLVTKNQTLYYKRGQTTIQCITKLLPKRYGKRITAYGTSGWNPSGISEEPGSLFQSSVSNAALIGIIKKIRKFETSDFAGPTFTGELRETLSMIKSPLKSLRLKTGLFTDLHMRILRDKQAKSKKFNPDPWRKVLTDTYLEWTFGAAPLISDIAAIADVVLDSYGRQFGPKKGLKRLSYRFSDTYNSSIDNPHSINWPGTGVNIRFTQIDHFRSSYQYVVWLDQDIIDFPSDQLEWLANAAKFDLAEIIPTAWELMPWSFLIDYFTNIGDVLGCTFNFNRAVAFAKVTSFNTCTRFHTSQRATCNQAEELVVDFVPHDYTSQYTVVRRNSVSKLGFPQLDTSLPNLGQVTNILALISSLQNNNPFRGFSLK